MENQIRAHCSFCTEAPQAACADQRGHCSIAQSALTPTMLCPPSHHIDQGELGGRHQKVTNHGAIRGLRGSGSCDGRRANPEHEYSSGLSGAQRQSLWLSCPGEDREDASSTTLCLCGLHSSFKFPGETLTCPACSQVSANTRESAVVRGQCAKIKHGRGDMAVTPTQFVSDAHSHLRPFAHAHPCGEQQEVVPRPGNRNSCIFLFPKTCLQRSCLHTQCPLAQGFRWAQSRSVEGRELILFSRNVCRNKNVPSPETFVSEETKLPSAWEALRLPCPAGMPSPTHAA